MVVLCEDKRQLRKASAWAQSANRSVVSNTVVCERTNIPEYLLGGMLTACFASGDAAPALEPALEPAQLAQELLETPKTPIDAALLWGAHEDTTILPLGVSYPLGSGQYVGGQSLGNGLQPLPPPPGDADVAGLRRRTDKTGAFHVALPPGLEPEEGDLSSAVGRIMAESDTASPSSDWPWCLAPSETYFPEVVVVGTMVRL